MDVIKLWHLKKKILILFSWDLINTLNDIKFKFIIYTNIFNNIKIKIMVYIKFNRLLLKNENKYIVNIPIVLK